MYRIHCNKHCVIYCVYFHTYIIYLEIAKYLPQNKWVLVFLKVDIINTFARIQN